MSKKIILAITGASGSLYAVQFLKLMQQHDVEVHGIISDAGRLVLQHELGYTPDDLNRYVTTWHAIDNFAAPVSSGSSSFDAMLVLPCTMGTLGAIANGMVKNLVHRAADVMLKESKPLLLAVRETPFNRIHLENMLKVHDAGAVVCPPMPSFYHHPENLEEMAAFFAGRLADQLGFEVKGLKRWQGI
ncbi:MAG: UbiX family flavin prenyltransferase [Deltaproteobacteria bacterium]|jgi:4-hydroxy-3-polyprenylbenzoate decarboxylase|nr:UbiX family flavin prenyltransferase [Deltaproteobacteria bacterium]